MTHPAGGVWRYEPNDDYVAHLDDVFRQGNAPRLAGMLLSLANPSNVTGKATPCYLDIPAMLPLTPDDAEFTSHEVTGSGQIGADVYSILRGSARSIPMPDLSVEQFFHHADILSGQDVGKMRPHPGTKLDRLDLVDGGFVERAVAAVDSTRTGETTVLWSRLAQIFLEQSRGEGSIWHDWTGQAADEAKQKFTDVNLWFSRLSDGEFRQRALLGMSAILIQYAATIHGARMNLDNLMGELVDQVNEWNDKTNLGASPGKWVALTQIKNLAEPRMLGIAFKVVEAVAESADSLTAEKKLPENQVYNKLASYLEAAENIVQDTVGQVDALVRDLNHLREGRELVDIPVWTE